MAGRTVTLPETINSVVTVGGVPMLNSYVFIAGQGDKLAMGLPTNWDHTLWRNQFVFAPQLAELPLAQNSGNSPDLERIIDMAPDVVLASSTAVVELLETNGITVAQLRLNTPEDIKDAVALVGRIFGDAELGARYEAYFARIQDQLSERLASIPEDQRPTVLYVRPGTLTQPHMIAEWWIPAGGGHSVTADGRTQGALSLTAESIIAADPDVLVLTSVRQKSLIREDAVLSQLDAVRKDRIAAPPVGAHAWGSSTVEIVLSPLWMATVLHPDLFPQAELIEETRRFYADFFKVDLSTEQVESILHGWKPNDS
ncbi:ABC transporter substrate-binding protein [Tropicimonas sp.]|uniref:ABC transporter substrate-binding protein n=1 Tax=Tropicimonas sp. TaxID=2067044 RepID=UPI003A8432D3